MRQASRAEVSRFAVRCAFLLPIVILVLILGTASAQTNPIVTENQQPGTAAWDIPTDFIGTDNVGQIKGYASAVSINKGESITFYVSTNPAQTFTIDVYRIGWYQGLGGRLMQHIGPLNGVTQPTCPMDATTGMIECHWTPAYTLSTQTSWTSGIYFGVLTNANGFQNLMIFVVRDDSRVAALLYQAPVATNQAYNDWPDDGKTGKSLYDYNSYGAVLAGTGYKEAAKVSFDRPYQDSGIDEGFRSDYGEVNFIRWMESSGYDVSYTTDVDTHLNGSHLLNYKGVLSMGHDEYWSKPMYDAAIAARDAGVNLGFFEADAVSWQIRFESSSSGVANRVIVCYRDATLDPIADQTLKTVNWRDPVLNRPEQVLMGIQYDDNSYPPQNNQGFFPSYVATNSGNWVYAGTGLTDGTPIKGLVGYEADGFDSIYPGPNAVSGTYFLLSHSPWGTGPYDYSNSSIYQAPSGAWVFATGTMSWNWALDDYGHGYNLVDPRVQRTTANVLNRFVSGSGAQNLPTVTSVTPLTGPTSGGTAITITGTNFVAGATVTLGSTAATNITVVNSTTITASTPAGTAGTANLTVTNPGGQSGTLSNAFMYALPPPTVASVTPVSGSTTGGTAITITGTNFVAGATVSLGGSAATGVTVVNSTTITATTPAGSAGTVNVTVTNPGGQSGALSNAFTYNLTAPTVSNVLPNTGLTTGGTAITITGTNFVAGATVTLGSTAATGVTVVNSTTITATTPAHAAGPVSLTVTNTDGQNGTRTAGFTYVLPAPTVGSISPNTGLTTGGTPITITGTNFAASATVSLSGSAATGVTVVNGTTITATTPAHAAGAVSVTVTNPDAQSGTLASGFTYTALSAPTLVSITPNSGLRGTAVPVTLTGTNFAATGTTVAVSGTGVTVGAITAVNSTTITATFTIAATATISARNVSVTTSSGTSNTQAFTVLGPVLTSITPNTGERGTSVPVTLTGSGLTGATAITVSGSGVTVSNVTVVNDTTVTATFTITSGAGLTARTIKVTTAQSGTSNGVTFTAVLPPVPTLSSVAPNSGMRGSDIPVTLTGTDFTAAGTKITVSGSGVTASNLTVLDNATITATFTITTSASLSSRSVTVTTPGGTSNTQTFTVQGPTLSSVTPNPVTHGSGVLLTLTGTNLAGATAVTVSGTGSTCTVSASAPTAVNATCTLTAGVKTVRATTPIGTTGTVSLTVN